MENAFIFSLRRCKRAEKGTQFEKGWDSGQKVEKAWKRENVKKIIEIEIEKEIE